MLLTHPMRGRIFENFIIAELKKLFFSYGKEPPLHFWRDQHGHEVDALLDLGDRFECLEIKSGATFQTHWLKTLHWFSKLDPQAGLSLVYGGDKAFDLQGIKCLPYQGITDFVQKII